MTATPGSALGEVGDDPAEIERRVLAEQVDALFVKGVLPHFTSVINGSIVVVALAGFAPWTPRLGWLTAVCAVAAARIWLGRQYRRRSPPAAEARRWGNLYAWGAGFNGAVWGAVPLIFPTRGHSALHALMTFVIGGLVAGATATGSSYQPAYRAFTIPALAPMIVLMLTSGGRIEMAMGAMLTLFGVAMGVLSRSAGLTFVQTTRLRLRNAELVQRLADARDQLERRVRDRTAALEATLDEQRRAEAKAQQAVRARDEFMAVASHELLTPLSALQIHLRIVETEVARLDAAASQPLRNAVPTFTRQVARLTALVDTVFRVSGLDSQQLVLEPREIDLAALVTLVVADLEANDTVNPGGSLIRLDLREPLRGRWDRVRLEQIVINLLSNALKYGAGRPVTIAADADPQGSGRVLLAIADQGPGIAPEDRQRIFEKFHRGAEASGQHGLGLGLFVVKQLVAAMEGTITVDATPGGGTTFRVSLPRAGGGDSGG